MLRYILAVIGVAMFAAPAIMTAREYFEHVAQALQHIGGH